MGVQWGLGVSLGAVYSSPDCRRRFVPEWAVEGSWEGLGVGTAVVVASVASVVAFVATVAVVVTFVVVVASVASAAAVASAALADPYFAFAVQDPFAAPSLCRFWCSGNPDCRSSR